MSNALRDMDAMREALALESEDPCARSPGGGAFMDGPVAQRADDAKDEWLTPRAIVDDLGPFDLDPCAPLASRRPWPTANEHFTIEDNGLRREWHGRVWMNPPYARRHIKQWMGRLAGHGNGIALTFARTDTEMFQTIVFKHASAIFFVKGRITFLHVSGLRSDFNGGAPSVLVAFGRECAHRLGSFTAMPGHFMWLNE